MIGFYRQLPVVIRGLTPGELFDMQDGIDWVNDREWERALFLKTSFDHGNEILSRSFPAAAGRAKALEDSKVTFKKSGKREGPVPGKTTFGGVR